MIENLTNICNDHKQLFSTVLNKQSATVAPMVLEANKTLWERRSNKGTPREQTLEKQKEIDKQLEELFKNNIIEPSTVDIMIKHNVYPMLLKYNVFLV